ncbi:MAG: PilC/PilY family type IV pilus protein [Xanthomonadales bacterium]|jgi:type IV pilus assembly protein PilY1|nr:PilC/PilY family type IV pilus protein [Xanthomonadales bacterium]
MQSRLLNILLTASVGFLAGMPVQSHAQGFNVAQGPLFLRTREAPLNMLVIGRDHKLFYEAYNDASDLNFDGKLDIGYRGHLADDQGGVTYFGYFDSFKCYSYNGGVFEPVSVTANKRCSGAWSGDFLNYLTTARFDALRKVLYGGTRVVDEDGRTVLERARIVQDAHSWGKEYTSIARDGYNIAEFAPLQPPPPNLRHLFASTSLLGTSAEPDREATPLLRVLNDTPFRIWNWISIERPVADSTCFNASNARVSCERITGANEWQSVPQNFFNGSTRMTTWLHDGNIERPNIGNFGTTPVPPRRTGPPNNRFELNQMFNGPTGNDSLNNGLANNLQRGWVGNARLNPANNTYTNNAYRCGTNNINRTLVPVNGFTDIDGQATLDNNPWAGTVALGGTCGHDRYIAQYTGNIRVPTAGVYEFAVDVDDAAHFELDLTTATNSTDGSRYETLVVGRYGLNGICNCTTFNGSVTLPANTNVPFRFQYFENEGRDTWDLKIRLTLPDSRITDYAARVEVCNRNFPEANCKVYPNGNLKPTGLLHDYGESDTMMFGLITGSFNNNTQGGKLRKAVSSFRNEVDPDSGRFTTAQGIVYTLDRFRIVGFGSGYQYNGCSVWTRPINNGECRPWGNPVGEMLFEAMRYWAGAVDATPAYIATPSGNDEGTLSLTRATWNASTNPYAPGNFVYCAKPFNTVISDINPSYDSNLPGSAWSPAYSGGSLPATMTNFNASTLGQDMWAMEYGGSRNVFIGEVGSLNDGAPTAKTVASFGNIRGLSPEEPTKQGTYYSAMVAYYGRITDMNAALDPQIVQTFGVALASPLPRIVFPVGNGTITMVPFAKSGGGGSVQPDTSATNFNPTNQIVDFYIEQLVNTDEFNRDSTVNEGRPYGVFRINFEDIEQGNDHDMDMILRYLLQVTEDNKLFIQLTSEYAAGGVNQIGGYVISGTTEDGIYLELLDMDATPQAYRFNTPPGRPPGYCELPRTTEAATECANMPGRRPTSSPNMGLTAARTFTPGATSGAQLLKDPLWYMAKYGGFLETGTPNNIPDRLDEWDLDRDGNPDNYFLVTNALRLREQLGRAFEEVLRRAAPSGAVATNSTRVDLGGLAYQSVFDSGDWSGDVKGILINELGDPIGSGPEWEAKELLVNRPFNLRNIVTTRSRNEGIGFRHSVLTPTQQQSIAPTDALGDAIVNWVRGDRSNEEPNGLALRRRTSLIADVLNSNPAVMSNQDFGYCRLPEAEGGCTGRLRGETTGPYATFLRSKANNKPTVFIGANGGMLHALDGSRRAQGGGTELFGFVPRAVIPNLSRLVERAYDHRYFVDGSPTIGDAYLNGSWRTVLVGTTGAGGRSVFALDVTNPAGFSSSNVLWELTEEDDPDIGLTIGRASIVKLQTGEWAAVFGNGYNSQTHRAMLFVVNLETGALIRKYDTGVGTPAQPNGLGTPTVADTEGLFGDTLAADAKGNFAYAGDMYGNLWRFDLSSAAAPVRLFRALDANGRPQHIVAAPAVQAYGGPVPSGSRGLMVYFGTGRFFVVGDNEPKPNDPRHAFYGIRDIGEAATITTGQLVRQSISDSGVVRTTSQNRVDYVGGQRGFWIDLSSGFTGERIVTSPVFRFGQVFFGTYAPLGGSCNPSSRGFIMSVSPFSGIGTLEALGVNVSSGGAGLYVQSSSPVPPTLLVTDRYLLALTQIDPGNIGNTTPNPACQTNPNLPECVVSGASKIAIPRVSGRLSWKQLR